MNEHCFGITNLGSGSSGNASVIHGPEGNILVDDAFSCKEIRHRMEESGIDPETIRAILVSHNHNDHTRGCRVFAEKHHVPMYMTNYTYLANFSRIEKNRAEILLFQPGTVFSLCGVTVEPFLVPHDVPETVAFTFSCGGEKIAIATDLGCINNLARLKLAGCTVLMLESNHDLTMLRNSGRTLKLIRRIMSKCGHLSNDDAAEELANLITEKTRTLILGHLSEDCNDPELVSTRFRERLAELGRKDVVSMVAHHESPLPTVWAL